MMRICITLDDVIRAKTLQMGKIYKKYIDKDIDLENLDISSGNWKEIFGFDSNDAFNKFLYTDYVYEIFAEAPVTDKMVDKQLNLWHLKADEDDVEIVISNPREFNFTLGYTCFFLSKIATRAREFRFPKDSSEIWDFCDVLITADKGLIEGKPEGKTCVRIEMPYNTESEGDLSYPSLKSLLMDDKFFEKVRKENKE